MAPLCESLTLAVETDVNAAPDGRLFAPVNYSLERLSKMAAEKGVSIEREALNQELDAPEDIRILEKGLYALGAEPSERQTTCIELCAASGKRQEVHLAAARMRQLAAAGESVSQMAVVYPKGSGYAPLLQSILPMYGLEAYAAEKRQAGGSPNQPFSALRIVGSFKRLAAERCIGMCANGLSGHYAGGNRQALRLL